MSENTPQPAAPQQPQSTQQAPAAQPTHGAPAEAPKKKKWAAVTALVLGIISALTGFIIPVSYTHLDVYKRQLPRCHRWAARQQR